MQPLIGLTSYFVNTKDRDNKPLEHFLAPNVYVSYPYYPHKVECAGGIPVNIPYYADDATIGALAERLDGILFIGGEDIDPKYYGESFRGSEKVVSERDTLEFKLFEAFFAARKPILGICRGMQLMNVFFKGSLIQDILSENKGYINHSRSDDSYGAVHKVQTVAGTKVHALLGGNAVGVNTLHHQAARKIGEGLVVAATSEDGIVEAIERPDYPFMIGLQWHPERLDMPPHFALFEEFVKAAKSLA